MDDKDILGRKPGEIIDKYEQTCLFCKQVFKIQNIVTTNRKSFMYCDFGCNYDCDGTCDEDGDKNDFKYRTEYII